MSREGAAFAAVVLAGGRSSRMGTDKWALPHPNGGTLLERQLALLRQLQPSELLVSARSGQVLPVLPPDVREVCDDGAAGPLGGIVAALRATALPRLLVVAVDLPHLDANTLHTLLATPPDRGSIPRLDGRLEPLVALYPRGWLPHAEAGLSRGDLSLQCLLATREAEAFFDVIPVISQRPFTNWNTPTDMDSSGRRPD